MQASVAISYFHRKIGPMVYYSFPELVLDEKEKIRLADIMDQAFEEGFFTHKFSNLYSMNYYFEIPSDWARGNKEMLMISIIVDVTPSPEVEDTINLWCEAFANRLKTEDTAFKAFYDKEDPQVRESDIDDMEKSMENIQDWLQEIYWLAIEELREKSEEEKWAEIMSKPQIFKIIKKLSKGPMKKEDLRRYFETIFPKFSFDDVFNKLEEEKFIFSNVIGHETFVLLVKEVKITRVPPNCVIDLKEDNPELEDLTQIYIGEVADFFESYKPNPLDGFELFKLFANPKIYNVISQLRSGPLSRDKVLSMVSEKAKKNLQENLKLLEEKEIIQEFSYSGENLYLLKSDVMLRATFPEYLKKLLPKDSKGYVAKSLSPKQVSEEKELEKLEGGEQGITAASNEELEEEEIPISADTGSPDTFLKDRKTPSFSLANNRKNAQFEGREIQNGEDIGASYLYSLDMEEESNPEDQELISEKFKKLLKVDEGEGTESENDKESQKE